MLKCSNFDLEADEGDSVGSSGVVGDTVGIGIGIGVGSLEDLRAALAVMRCSFFLRLRVSINFWRGIMDTIRKNNNNNISGHI